MTPAHQAFYDAVLLLQGLKEFTDTGRDQQLLDQIWEIAWADMIEKGKRWLAEAKG